MRKYDWSRFYQALCKKAPDLLCGIDEGLRSDIALHAEITDEFWSEELEELLAMGVAEGDFRRGVRDVLGRWHENVAAHLEERPFTQTGGDMRLDLETEAAQSVIRELVEAAESNRSD